ncbi:hypothetical protein [Allopusillimonas ginsengisoli]|uniref:hypothetical protein n=1 Tax=Allopusillimonas ginsengisoli TaxID=453575 RepID=UPI0010210C23|nr:hypothetical protein [Allopusillimonas ginsengisoli]TEA79851.1 hypothetical protein ERE07_02620 [Allopusillimonas ginsengisoli]
MTVKAYACNKQQIRIGQGEDVMARYISREILCEAYTHLDINLYSNKQALQELERKLKPFFEERAKFLLGDDVTVEIKFEPGSLKTRLTVLGSAGLIMLNTLTSYGSFRQGVEALSRDAASLAESANLEVLFRTRTPYCDRINIERRKGVFGRVDDHLSKLDAIGIAISSSDLPRNDHDIQQANALVDRLVDWNIQVSKLFTKLESPDTIACVAEGLEYELNKFTKTFPWSKRLQQSSLRGQLARADPGHHGKLVALAARLTTTVTSIQKDMTARHQQSGADGAP